MEGKKLSRGLPFALLSFLSSLVVIISSPVFVPTAYSAGQVAGGALTIAAKYPQITQAATQGIKWGQVVADVIAGTVGGVLGQIGDKLFNWNDNNTDNIKDKIKKTFCERPENLNSPLCNSNSYKAHWKLVQPDMTGVTNCLFATAGITPRLHTGASHPYMGPGYHPAVGDSNKETLVGGISWGYPVTVEVTKVEMCGNTVANWTTQNYTDNYNSTINDNDIYNEITNNSPNTTNLDFGNSNTTNNIDLNTKFNKDILVEVKPPGAPSGPTIELKVCLAPCQGGQAGPAGQGKSSSTFTNTNNFDFDNDGTPDVQDDNDGKDTDKDGQDADDGSPCQPDPISGELPSLESGCNVVFTDTNFLQYAISKTSTKFPFDILGTMPTANASICPTWVFFGQSHEFCEINQFLKGVKWVVWIVFAIKSVLAL